MDKTYINPWSRFLKLLQLEKKDIYSIYFYAIAGGILSMSLPLGIQSVIRFIQSGQITTTWFVLIFLVILGAILTGVMQIMQLRITENIQQRLFVNYSFDFAHRFPRLKEEALKNDNPNELINRFFDIMGLQKGFSKVLLDFTSALLQIIFSLLVLSLYHPFYIAFSILLVLLLILIFKPFIKRGLETSLKESKHKYATAFWLQEITRSSWSFRTAASEQLSLQRLDDSAANYVNSREAHFQILVRQFIWTIAFKVLIITSLLGLGGYLVITQQINLGQFVAAEVLILLLLAAVEKVIQSMDNLYDVCTSLEKLEQVRDLPACFDEKSDTEHVELFPLEVLKNDGFTENEIIFSANKGEKICLIGKNKFSVESLMKQCLQNAKSTNYITRWNYAIPSDQQLEGAFHQLGWFSSESRLIDGTIEDTITLKRPHISSNDLEQILVLLDIDYIVKNEINGWKTQISEIQSRLTPQEIELILFARALVNSPSLLLISFWNSSLSLEKQKALLNITANLLPETTIICGSENQLTENWQLKKIN